MAKTNTAAEAGEAIRGELIRLRNTKRAQWFFKFRVTSAEAEAAEGVHNLKIEQGSWVDPKAKTKDKIVEAQLCTLVLGDAQADTDRGENKPEAEIPVVIWEALQREPTQWRIMQGLIAKGEISIYAPRAAA